MKMTIFLQLCCLGKCSGVSFIDSTPLRVRHIKCEHNNETFNGLAAKGKSTMGWFYVFKLHIVINDKGEIPRLQSLPEQFSFLNPFIIMLKLICASIIQSFFLAAGQVFLKFGLERFEKFSWTWKFFRDFLTNRWLFASGMSMIAASAIWFYILKHNDLSLAYPLISISYIFGTLAAVFIFHETVPPTRWIGVLLIMAGVAFLTRSA